MESLRPSHENRFQDYTNWIIFEPITLRRSLLLFFLKNKFGKKKVDRTKVDRTFEIFMLWHIRGYLWNL